MCGGLVLSVARTRAAQVAYHLGRLAGYVALGSLAGAAGGALLSGAGKSGWLEWLSWAATAGMAAIFLLAAARAWRGRAFHFPVVPSGALAWLFSKGKGSAAACGLLTALLPCGWLHGFVLGAVATRSAASGAAFLFVFWLGTLPALSFAPWIAATFIRPLSRRAPKLVALLLVAAGALSVAAKVAPGLQASARGEPAPACHSD
jgi:hypothetical protein